MNKALEALTRYLNGEIDLDSLEERIIPLAWDDKFENQDLVDLITIEIAYINDGVSDELTFRSRMAEFIALRRNIAITLDDRVGEFRVSNVTGSLGNVHFHHIRTSKADYRVYICCRAQLVTFLRYTTLSGTLVMRVSSK